MEVGKDISSNYGIFNPGTLNPHQLAQLLAVLSDDSVDNTTLDSLQKKLSRSFIAGDSMKVRKNLFVTRKYPLLGYCLIPRVTYERTDGRTEPRTSVTVERVVHTI